MYVFVHINVHHVRKTSNGTCTVHVDCIDLPFAPGKRGETWAGFELFSKGKRIGVEEYVSANSAVYTHSQLWCLFIIETLHCK